MSSEREDLLERLRYYSLASLKLEVEVQNIHLNFVSTVEGEEDVSIKLFDPLLVKISRTSDDEGPFLVGNISLTALSREEEKDLMDKLGYCFREPDTDSQPAFTKQLFHFFLEGSICIDVVCEGHSM